MGIFLDTTDVERPAEDGRPAKPANCVLLMIGDESFILDHQTYQFVVEEICDAWQREMASELARIEREVRAMHMLPPLPKVGG